MSHKSIRDFIDNNLSGTEVLDKVVLEVGSKDFNGEIRGIIAKKNPRSYTGVDMQKGPGVDKVCNVCDLVNTFGNEVYDIVVTAETFEHVKKWKDGINNIKRVLRPGGILILTTRSVGMDYHGYPNDYWRYQVEDIKDIFADFEIINNESDPTLPGVLVKCTKPKIYKEHNLNPIKLYSMLTRFRIKKIVFWHYIYFVINSLRRRILRLLANNTNVK